MCMFGIVCSKTLDKLQLDHLISYSKDYLSKKQLKSQTAIAIMILFKR